MLQDALVALSWLRREAGFEARLVVSDPQNPQNYWLPEISTQVWGHSMGAAVASLAVASTAANVNHLVLESPFNNLADEVSTHVLISQQCWPPFCNRWKLNCFGSICLFSVIFKCTDQRWTQWWDRLFVEGSPSVSSQQLAYSKLQTFHLRQTRSSPFLKICFLNTITGASLHTHSSPDPTRRGRWHNLSVPCQEALCRRQEKWQKARHCDEGVSKGARFWSQSHPQGGRAARAVG